MYRQMAACAELLVGGVGWQLVGRVGWLGWLVGTLATLGARNAESIPCNVEQ